MIGIDVIPYKGVSCEKVDSFVGPTLSLEEAFYLLVRGRPEIVPNKSSLLMFIMGWMSIHAGLGVCEGFNSS